MTALPIARPHQPLPPDALIALPNREAVLRAGHLVGVPMERLPTVLHPAAPLRTLAATRAATDLLLLRLEQTYPACPACSGTERDLDCARELGVLEERLASVAGRARLAMAVSHAPRGG